MTSNFHFFRYKYIFIVFHFNFISRVDDIYRCYSAAATPILLSVLLTIHYPGAVWYTFSDKYEIMKIIFYDTKNQYLLLLFSRGLFSHSFIADLSGPRMVKRINSIFNFSARVLVVSQKLNEFNQSSASFISSPCPAWAQVNP